MAVISATKAPQTAYIVLHVQKLRTCLQIRITKAERFAVETHYFRIHSTSVRAARTHNQTTTGCYDQAPAMNWDLVVSWGREVWVSLSDSARVGLASRNKNTDEGTKPAHWVLSPSTSHELVSWGSGVWDSVSDRRSSTRATHTQNQTTGYHDHTPAMNWSAGVGGSGLALAIALGSGCPSGIET